MGRSLAILALFGLVLGAFVCWGPLQISVAPRQSAAMVETTPPVVQSVGADSVPSVPVTRKSEKPGAEESAREPVLAATSPASTPTGQTARSALPEQKVRGFPQAPTAKLSSDDLSSAIKQSSRAIEMGQLVEARDRLSEIYLGHRLTSEQRVRLADVLEPLMWELMRSRTVVSDGVLYEVEPGDTLIKLAKHFRVPPEFVMKLNDIQNARLIRRGQTLRFVEGPFDVLVELGDFELTVLQKGKFVRRYSIGTGKEETPTPPGIHTVKGKLIDPTFFGPGAPPIPGRAPNNPLGSRWIDFGMGYGIHGTNEPDTICQRASRGCIRMRNEHVEELYDMLTEGSRVLIRP